MPQLVDAMVLIFFSSFCFDNKAGIIGHDRPSTIDQGVLYVQYHLSYTCVAMISYYLAGHRPASKVDSRPFSNKTNGSARSGWLVLNFHCIKKIVKQKLTTYRHPTSWYYLSISMFDKQLTHLITLSKFSKLFVRCCQII